VFAIKLYQNPRWSASRAPVINVRPAMLPVIYKGGRARERDGARGGTRERRIERFLTRGERGARGSEEKIAARARARARRGDGVHDKKGRGKAAWRAGGSRGYKARGPEIAGAGRAREMKPGE